MSVQVIGALTQRRLPDRAGPIRAIVPHTTGDTDLAKILAFYTSPDGLCPHYSIDVEGEIRRHAFEEQVAWHCKIDPLEARLYQRGWGEWSQWHWPLGADAPAHVGQEFPGYRFWREQWLDRHASPLDLVTGDHPNTLSIGVELQQPIRPTPDCFTDAQYASLAALVLDINARRGVPLDRDHVLGHQDVSPMRRTTAAGGWDPGMQFNWNRLWDLVRAG